MRGSYLQRLYRCIFCIAFTAEYKNKYSKKSIPLFSAFCHAPTRKWMWHARSQNSSISCVTSNFLSRFCPTCCGTTIHIVKLEIVLILFPFPLYIVNVAFVSFSSGQSVKNLQSVEESLDPKNFSHLSFSFSFPAMEFLHLPLHTTIKNHRSL